ncbi:hypothetical protein Aab01nite_52770 [Paractinoplanes abujensis]|uniref:Protein kinase domain-containing protein n=1 Tax=Paractinoplanes abujensis TaxID=882441 RepID=A0A7W7G304_9ACTN|nr:hypothetical protein [Actinoplanes abujensis]MBB4693655.1 hypothetical protein [Actinoplanes abujensis]GID21687.1 hypothetical protein Aab01nite_52770 [Actinoplanes abujensis]
MTVVSYAPAVGRTLADVLREDGPLPVAGVRALGLQLLDLLERTGHGNLHPGSVYLHDDGRVALLHPAPGAVACDLAALGATLFAATGGRPGPLRPIIEDLLTADDRHLAARTRAALSFDCWSR